MYKVFKLNFKSQYKRLLCRIFKVNYNEKRKGIKIRYAQFYTKKKFNENIGLTVFSLNPDILFLLLMNY